MQWNAREHAGFTTGIPWLRVNPIYKEINAEEALAMIEAGATRIGASTGVAIVSGATGEGY